MAFSSAAVSVALVGGAMGAALRIRAMPKISAASPNTFVFMVSSLLGWLRLQLLDKGGQESISPLREPRRPYRMPHSSAAKWTPDPFQSWSASLLIFCVRLIRLFEAHQQPL